MGIRISGLNSGLDTDSIVKELVNAYSLKKETIVKQKTKLEWKQDKWKELNTKILALYKKTDTLRFSSGYNQKTTTSSDTTKATVTATNSAINGTQKLEIEKLAKTGYITGANLKDKTGSTVTKKSTLVDLGYTGGTGSIAVQSGGNTTYLDVTKDTTIEDFVSQLKGVGLTANFDETNQRLFVSAKESGKDNDFALAGMDADGASALSSFGVLTSSTANSDLYAEWEKYAKYDGSNNFHEGDTKNYIDSILTQMDGWKNDNTIQEQNIQDARDEAAEIKSLQNYAGHRKDLQDFKAKATGLTSFEPERMEVLMRMSDADLDANNGALRSDLEDLKTRSGLTDEELASMQNSARIAQDYEENAGLVGNTANVTRVDNALAVGGIGFDQLHKDLEKEYNDELEKITDAQDAITSNNKKLSDYKLFEDSVDMTAADRVDVLTNKVKSALDAMNGNFGVPANADATRIDAQNAIIYLNDAKFESATNDITVNGLTITALQETDKTKNESITITTATDTQGVYDNVKNFLTEYNTLVKEMDKLYNASSSKGYEPLTDEEKEEMSEDEIKKWEEKIKDSLLRRDDTLSAVTSIMSSAMSKTYEINGKKYSLASFGIKTTAYFSRTENEKNVFHIDGDPDETSVSGSPNRLMEMIQEEPEVVEEFFKQLTDGLYKELDVKMKGTEIRTSYTVYNDKQMAEDIKKYNKQIKKWEDKLEYYEKFYYDKFTAMETSLAKLQSNTNALSQLLGG